MVAALIAALLCRVNESWQQLNLTDANHIPERHPATGSIQLARAGARDLDGTQPPTGAGRAGGSQRVRGDQRGSSNPSHLTPLPPLLFCRLSASIRLLMRRKWLSRRNTPEISFPKLAVGQVSVGAGLGLPGKGAAARRRVGRGAGTGGPAPHAGYWDAGGCWVGPWGT